MPGSPAFPRHKYRFGRQLWSAPGWVITPKQPVHVGLGQAALVSEGAILHHDRMVVKEKIQILTHDEHVEQLFVNHLEPLDRYARFGVFDFERQVDSFVRSGRAWVQR